MTFATPSICLRVSHSRSYGTCTRTEVCSQTAPEFKSCWHTVSAQLGVCDSFCVSATSMGPPSKRRLSLNNQSQTSPGAWQACPRHLTPRSLWFCSTNKLWDNHTYEAGAHQVLSETQAAPIPMQSLSGWSLALKHFLSLWTAAPPPAACAELRAIKAKDI